VTKNWGEEWSFSTMLLGTGEVKKKTLAVSEFTY
jgi:hypothetical protein